MSFGSRTSAFLCVALAARVVSAALETAEEIDACIRNNQPGDSSIQTIALYASDRIGAITESRTKMYWKRFDDGKSKLMMRFSAPPDLRGAGLLMVERDEENNDMFLYLPELDKVKRITHRMVSGSMFGTDFSYEDFERLQGLSDDADLERLDDVTLEGKTVKVISSRPREGSGSAYEKVVTFVDPDTCVPLKVEFYEPGSHLRKVASVSRENVKKEGDSWIPHVLVMRDLRDETETRMEVEEIEIGAKVSRKMFSTRELEAGGR